MYDKKITTNNSGLIFFLLDDSGSTKDSFPGTTDPVYKWIERYSGIILKELLARCTEIQGDSVKIKPRYYVSVIQYGSKPQFWGEPIMDIETVINRYTEANNSFGLGGHLGGTDADAAFNMANNELAKLVKDGRFVDSFPPLVFHMSDGLSATDATPTVEKIKKLTTNDGNVVVTNAFIGAKTNLGYKSTEDFPGYISANEAGPSEDNIRLFHMSSKIPECIHQNLIDDGIFPVLRENSRLFFDVRTKEMLKHVIQVVGSIGSRADRTER